MKKLLTVLLLLPILVLTFMFMSNDDYENTTITYSDIEKIQPVAIIDDFTLVNEYLASNFVQNIQEKLLEDRVMVFHPMLGAIFNPKKIGYQINIIIESYGGMVSIGKGMSEVLNNLRSNGIIINCYVKRAMSAAFHLLITSCDRKIGFKDVELMQHKIHYSSGYVTSSTLNTDLTWSNKEASVLGVDKKEWLYLTRSDEDHYFTKEEIQKYKLLDSTL